jgi:hypothetical protein
MFTKADEWDTVEESVKKKVHKVEMLTENNARVTDTSRRRIIVHCSMRVKVT